MASRHQSRPPWRLACALFATMASAATIAPTNSSTGVDYQGTINLRKIDGNNNHNVTTLLPLTQDAKGKNLDGDLVLTSASNAQNLTSSPIAYISCDEGEAGGYSGNINADFVLQNVYDTKQAQAAILYSTTSNYCNYTAPTTPGLSDFPIYSTAVMGDARSIRDNLTAQDAGMKFFVRIAHSTEADFNGSSSGPQGQQNPLGPSPSTAVAMIILYSITGVITALFLVIIVTGAVRAHRHPDRYGPRNVIGRPRQSRARGLGMAILDTIPIVKFGEREQPKPADVELGSTSETRDVNMANTEATAPATETEARNETTTDTPRNTSARAEPIEGLDSGIAPAAAAVVTPTNADASADGGLGCSICTDDFEKGQDIRVLPCNHKFHPECVDPWLLNVSGTCPLCRVDLRPTTTHDSSTSDASADPNTLAPPLQSEPETSSRRHSTLRDVLSFRSRPNASADERISALRRLREQRRNGSGEAVTTPPNASSDNVAAAGASARDRRSNRMSVRLSDVFSGRRRGDAVREESPEAGASSASTTTTTAAAEEERR
ncbi:hypothetical protein BU23DRAFT_90010 [Bimuria novae-zelandiae CBS 107.79]|uniref:RING-type domain-containing protein n=1 Tax=Bimuria novae-zelandiae CBS 107.79 TaxID=1447943 RepID=A0A6A5VMZ0_9PLEO|nr:hypothetical protein BU23DRAFT_90010 [Bimuria novae-zelandiae CBS 107.79]